MSVESKIIKILASNDDNMPAQINQLLVAYPKVQRLNLPYCGIFPEGAMALAEAIIGTNLIELCVFGNAIGTQIAAKLILSSNHCKLKHLNLGSNHLSSSHLGSNPHWKHWSTMIASCICNSKLESLDLSNNNIGEWDPDALASLANNKLTKLNLSGNNICDYQIGLLALNLKRLKCLDLSNNNLTDEGAKVLVSVIPKSDLMDLNLKGNMISETVLNEIHTALWVVKKRVITNERQVAYLFLKNWEVDDITQHKESVHSHNKLPLEIKELIVSHFLHLHEPSQTDPSKSILRMFEDMVSMNARKRLLEVVAIQEASLDLEGVYKDEVLPEIKKNKIC